jgi:hypothetical protein
MAGHQIALIIDCTKQACAAAGYRERVMRLTESFNRPETAKASVYFVTDKMVHVGSPGQKYDPSKFTPPGSVDFNPFSQSVKKAIAMDSTHNTVFIITPALTFQNMGSEFSVSGDTEPSIADAVDTLVKEKMSEKFEYISDAEKKKATFMKNYSSSKNLPLNIVVKEQMDDNLKKLEVAVKKLADKEKVVTKVMVPSVDPELEKLIAEEEAIEAANVEKLEQAEFAKCQVYDCCHDPACCGGCVKPKSFVKPSIKAKF